MPRRVEPRRRKPRSPRPEPEPDATAQFNARRQLLRSMRAEMLPAVESVAGYTQILRNDAGDRPADMLGDLDKLLVSATELYDFIKAEIDSTWPEVETPEFDERLRKARHDIGNRLNHALGYCQFLLMEEHDRFFGAFAQDLEMIQKFCKNCEGMLARYKSLSDPSDPPPRKRTRKGAASPGVIPHYSASPARNAPVEPARILIVDDSADTCALLSKFLLRQKHDVHAAPDGRSALQLLATSDFDLVLLDFMMPGMSGFEVLQQIKGDDRLRHTPVIMISALDAVDDMVPCIECGADDYLAKPVDFSLLQARVNASLERMRLREREYGRYFGPELARQILRNPALIDEPRDADVSVMFCDIRGFSRISERLGPSETVRWLSDVMAELTECVRDHHGVPVNYIGDELVAMWGAPQERDDHAVLACRAAFDILARLATLSDRWRHIVGVDTDVGIGINSGVAQVGNTGSSVKVVYGPLGNTVNLASRVQGATKYLGTRLLITDGVERLLNGSFATRRLCQVRVLNINKPVELFELLGDEPARRTLKTRYEQALRHFENQEMPQAAAMLSQVLVDDAHDGPSLLLMSRVVQRLLHHDEKFEPVWELPGK